MLPFDTLEKSAMAIQQRRISAAELVGQALNAIASIDPEIHAFNSVLADRAMAQAKEVDQGLCSGPLAGIPIALKDNICTSFGLTTCSSRMLADFRSPYDATVVKKLEAAGAIIIGKTNLDEFAMGSSTENSAFGPTRNPWDPSRVPGGSSGGSAAALAAGMCCASIGSDTGGSIRQPASFCGLVGLKPTYGLVSRFGLVAFASSLDQIGPFGWTVRDAAIILGAIAGHDPLDSTSAPRQPADFLADLDSPVPNLRLGIVKEYSEIPGLDEHVKAALADAIQQYRGLGATLVDVSLPNMGYGIAAYYVIAPCEASSNLARYDGVHFGHRTHQPVRDIIELFSKSRAEGFGEEVQRRIMIGTYALSKGYGEKFYLQALRMRRRIKEDFDRAFTMCDAILTPTSPTPAFRLGEKSGDPLQMYLGDIFTVTCNIAGIPGISVPCGFSPAGLPIGMQLMGPTFSDARLLRIARQYEAATQWHTRRPQMSA